MNFDTAFDLLMTHEGGYSNHASDPGGKTRYGITEAVARENGYTGAMHELPLDVAKKIAKTKYWDACQCDVMPDALRYPLFDGAYNSGVGQSVKWLQGAAGVKADGVIGPMTRQAVALLDPFAIKSAMLGRRLRFLAELKNWSVFGNGWTRRVAAILEM